MMKTKITWADAVLYSRETPNKFDINPTLMETVGELHRKDKTGIFIKDPKTNYKATGKPVSKHVNATFLFIPLGMIVKEETI